MAATLKRTSKQRELLKKVKFEIKVLDGSNIVFNHRHRKL